VPPLAEGQIYDVGSLAVDCPVYIRGLIRCGTEKKYGQVVITWDGGFYSQYTDFDGAFTFPADVNKSAQVSIYTVDNKYKLLEITTPANRGDTLDLGNIEVCEQAQTGDNKFTLNGEGFNNRTFAFSDDTLQVYGYYDPEDSITIIWMYGVFVPDTVLFWTTFKGEAVGPATEVFFYILYNSTIYYAENSITGTSANLNVTKYSGVGGLLEGTFNGTLINSISSANIALTGGQFSVIRRLFGGPDVPIKDKIPLYLKEKLKKAR
jgi:hypothetical protein